MCCGVGCGVLFRGWLCLGGCWGGVDLGGWEGVVGWRLVEVSCGGVLNVLRGGVWRSVSRVVVPRGLLGGGGGVVDHPLSPAFADRADDVRLLGVSGGGFGVGFSVPGAARVLGGGGVGGGLGLVWRGRVLWWGWWRLGVWAAGCCTRGCFRIQILCLM